MHSKWTYIPEGVGKNPQETTCLTTPMTSKTKMESQPLTVDVTLSQNGKGAIFHVNCPSDGNHEGWMEGEEASTQAKQIWLWKLGCMLKIHGNIKCQCQFTAQWKLPQPYHFIQIHSTTHGVSHSQTFQKVTNYLLLHALQ